MLAAVFAVSQAYGGYGMGGGGYGPGPLAVHTRQSVQYIPTPSTGYAVPTRVAIDAMPAPVIMALRTFSSPVSIQHVHVPSPGSFRATASQDAPHVRVHTVTKPIIQELNEIIAPQRIVRQQVLPVQEEVQTIVARAAVPAGPVAFGGLGGFRR